MRKTISFDCMSNEITNKISDQNIKDMRLNMTETDAEEFDQFVEKHWGKESVFKIDKYKEEKKKEAKINSRGRKTKKDKEEENIALSRPRESSDCVLRLSGRARRSVRCFSRS